MMPFNVTAANGYHLAAVFLYQASFDLRLIIAILILGFKGDTPWENACNTGVTAMP